MIQRTFNNETDFYHELARMMSQMDSAHQVDLHLKTRRPSTRAEYWTFELSATVHVQDGRTIVALPDPWIAEVRKPED